MSIFNTTYQLSLNKDYVKHWGLVEAVREFIQNAIDSESPFKYEFRDTDSGIVLTLRYELTTLPAKTLLLGTTAKADNIDAIEEFLNNND